MKRKRRTAEERMADAREALERATNGVSENDGLVIQAFAMRGLEVTPRVDVFTYRAWQAAGRQVRRGEHGVKVVVWVPREPNAAERKRDPNAKGTMMPWHTTVFHVSQTDPIEPKTEEATTDVAVTEDA